MHTNKRGQYHATDACGIWEMCSTVIEVYDESPPVILCEDELRWKGTKYSLTISNTIIVMLSGPRLKKHLYHIIRPEPRLNHCHFNHSGYIAAIERDQNEKKNTNTKHLTNYALKT